MESGLDDDLRKKLERNLKAITDSKLRESIARASIKPTNIDISKLLLANPDDEEVDFESDNEKSLKYSEKKSSKPNGKKEQNLNPNEKKAIDLLNPDILPGSNIKPKATPQNLSKDELPDNMLLTPADTKPKFTNSSNIGSSSPISPPKESNKFDDTDIANSSICSDASKTMDPRRSSR
jgi:hypothetical protein